MMDFSLFYSQVYLDVAIVPEEVHEGVSRNYIIYYIYFPVYYFTIINHRQ